MANIYLMKPYYREDKTDTINIQGRKAPEKKKKDKKLFNLVGGMTSLKK
jgi:hypothetical protein